MPPRGEPKKDGLAVMIGIGSPKKGPGPGRESEPESEDMDPVDVALDEAYDSRDDREAWKETMRSVIEQIAYRCMNESDSEMESED